jgi:hypothetical protein
MNLAKSLKSVGIPDLIHVEIHCLVMQKNPQKRLLGISVAYLHQNRSCCPETLLGFVD